MKVCIAGGGAWGTALAHVVASCGHDVALWQRGQERQPCDALVLAVPAQALRDVATRWQPHGLPVIIAAKGIEHGTNLFMVEAQPLVLSGPSFAADVMKGLPTAVVLAAGSIDTATQWSKLFSQPHFRIYQSNDLRGVEIGGALKNVLAIACGIADGRGLGASARAALITRGFAELSRLGRKLGARADTLHGLSGLGDLLLTCSSAQSRNYAYGHRIGSGMTPALALAASKGVVEGSATASAAAALAGQHGVDMPIVLGVHGIIDHNADPGDIIKTLLARPATTEFNEET
jgi:glycerol-3-phosphate dehydrogenase (NAD(P)+)